MSRRKAKTLEQMLVEDEPLAREHWAQMTEEMLALDEHLLGEQEAEIKRLQHKVKSLRERPARAGSKGGRAKSVALKPQAELISKFFQQQLLQEPRDIRITTRGMLDEAYRRFGPGSGAKYPLQRSTLANHRKRVLRQLKQGGRR